LYQTDNCTGSELSVDIPRSSKQVGQLVRLNGEVKCPLDQLSVGDCEQIIDLENSSKDNKNCCLFVAMFNALRTVEQRKKFSMNNLSDPFRAFRELVDKIEISQNKNKKKLKEGYTAEHMFEYLKF
jgi:hypothetical protein